MSLSVKLYSEPDVLSELDRSQVRTVLRSAFAGITSDSTVQPSQTVVSFPSDEGDCIFYPGLIWDLGLVGVKVSPYISALKRAGRYPVTAYTLLLSVSDGTPLLLCDSYALTTARTAATTALAIEYLMPQGAEALSLIGVGKVGLEHLRYVAEQHSWKSIRVWSPTLGEDAAQARSVADQLKEEGITVSVARTAKEAVSQADVVMLCTSSGTPVIERDWLKSNVLVTSISTNVPKAHEIDPSALSSFAVYCDYRETAPVTAGEMMIAQESGDWAPDQIQGDLPELAIGKAMPPAQGAVFFRSTGLGIEDLAVASLLL